MKKIKNNKVINLIGKISYTLMVLIVILVSTFAVVQKLSDNRFSIGGIKIFTVITGSMIPVYEIGDIIKVKNMPMDEDYYGVYIYDENQKRNKHIVITFDEEPSFFKFNRFENTEKVTKSPNEKINEISKKIKEMNGDFATVLQDIGIKIEILPF